MKILVTGGAGFIGSNIVDQYIDMGHSVVVVDNLVTGQRKYVHQKATFYEADITNKKRISEIFAKEKPEILNHHAAQMDVRRSVADPVFDAQVNIIGLLTLLECARKNDLKKVIFASSGGAVYGDAETIPTPESYPTQPASPYGVSKLSSEQYLDFYSQAYGIPAIALRYGNVYGPRQNPHGEAGVVAIFTQKMLKGEQPIIYGNGQQSRDFVYVGDVVEANVKALALVQSIKINIGTSCATTINSIFDTLVLLTKSKIGKKYGPGKIGEQKISVLDYTLATKTLTWHPKLSIYEGLTKTVNFFKNETT